MERHIFQSHIKEQCPFRVQTELANIQVLGTQFQVTANANQTSATVESGKVPFL